MTVTSILKEREASIIEVVQAVDLQGDNSPANALLPLSSCARNGKTKGGKIDCDKAPVSGAVSQKACVFCGARVVLNPITDALHIIHGPIGCSSYTWDIRGSLSSGSDLFRQSFSTDMQEIDIVFGGEKKLARAIDEAMLVYSPRLIFVYATCIVGVIGDDVEAVCLAAEKRHATANNGGGVRVIPVMAPGFSGHKAKGYQLAGDAIMRYLCDTAVEPDVALSEVVAHPHQTVQAETASPIESRGGNLPPAQAETAPLVESRGGNLPPAQAATASLVESRGGNLPPAQAATAQAGSGDVQSVQDGVLINKKSAHGINILGDFNLAGETWIVRNYLQQLGIEVLGSITGDSNSVSLLRAREARLNIVQCAGSSINLAEKMEARLGIPYIRVSFYGIEDTCASITRTAAAYAALLPDGEQAKALVRAAREFCDAEAARAAADLEPYRRQLAGKKAAIYVGGGFKAVSLIRQFAELGMQTVMVGTQTGRPEDYEEIRSLVSPGCVILDDANPAELEKFLVEKGADILVGGVKERPLAYKLGVAFCDHNHERKHPLAGFVGVRNFAREVNLSLNSPVWRLVGERADDDRGQSGGQGSASAQGDGSARSGQGDASGNGDSSSVRSGHVSGHGSGHGDGSSVRSGHVSGHGSGHGDGSSVRSGHGDGSSVRAAVRAAVRACEQSRGQAARLATPLVSLDTNPCKMCMPMGVVTAAYGIAGNMVVLHGSQGCATYIRRHMATHYNEPIDIASSALTEQGTVYGGESNLKKAIDNFIRLYQPEIITVATSCLAETIGENVRGILESWQTEHPNSGVTFVPVSSPGYGGTQFEGYFAFLRALLESVKPLGVAQETAWEDAWNTAHEEANINIICGPVSPADMRTIKQLLKTLGIRATLLPDYSQGLDGGHLPQYSRVHQGGTTLAALRAMAGARHTIELATFVDDSCSPAAYLRETYSVPYTRLNVPSSLADIDAFIAALAPFATDAAGLATLASERARYLDAMIDSHKYSAQGRACIFGEPDFVYSIARACLSWGVVPVVVATASACPELAQMLAPDISHLAEAMLVNDYTVVDNADFAQIEHLALAMGANIMIGSSDARRIAANHGIPLVRAAFPVHDHIGGQRLRMLGFDGSLELMDRIVNALLDKLHGDFRQELKSQYL